MNCGALDRESIGRLLEGPSPLVESYISLERQLQPNGFDLTLREVACFTSSGRMGSHSADRELSDSEPLQFDPSGWVKLGPRPYLVVFNEVVHLPLDVIALGRSRSSLLRSGVGIHTAVWDAGYRGRSQALLTVYNPEGFWVQQDAGLMQLVFFRLSQPVAEGYQGRFLDENL